MITAVDTNVLVDIFRSDSAHHSQSREWLRTAYDAGAIIICDIVYAELVPAFGGRATLDGALRQINVTLSAIDTSIAYEAGVRRMQYRAAGGPGNGPSPASSLAPTPLPWLIPFLPETAVSMPPAFRS